MNSARPLTGKRVVVTQATHQAPELARLLQDSGATVLLYPCIAIEPPQDTTELDRALADISAGRYDWLVLTSANTVRVLSERAKDIKLLPGLWASVRIAAIGPATDEAVQEHFGRSAELVPDENVAEGLGAALLAAVKPGQRVLVPQADIARPVLVKTLQDGGLDAVPVVAYRTTTGRGGVELAALLAAGDRVDAITFTSSSTVRNLLQRLGSEGGDPSRLGNMCLAAIGPVTAETLQAAGLAPTVVAQDQSLEGLVAALIAHWKSK